MVEDIRKSGFEAHPQLLGNREGFEQASRHRDGSRAAKDAHAGFAEAQRVNSAEEEPLAPRSAQVAAVQPGVERVGNEPVDRVNWKGVTKGKATRWASRVSDIA